MKDGGIVPVSHLQVTVVQKDDHSTTVTVKSPTADKHTPIWEGAQLTPGDVKEVKYTPVSKDGKQGDTKTVPVTDNKKPIDVEFHKPTEAHHIIIVLVPTSDKTTTSQLVSVKACLDDGKLIFDHSCQFNLMPIIFVDIYICNADSYKLP